MPAPSTPDVVSGVLDRMEHHARTTRLAIMGAAVAEGALMVVGLLTVNWNDRTQVLLFIFAILSYMIIALGLVALAAHVSRVGARIVAALDERDRSGDRVSERFHDRLGERGGERASELLGGRG